MYNVCIFMSVYNGEKYLKRQLESLFAQKYVNIDIIIRDDGSTDHSIKLIEDFNSKKIKIYKGKNLGYAKSFWLLLDTSSDYDYFAFCDQDDIWMEDKLISAIKVLSTIDGPALYTSDVISVNENEKVLKKNAFGIRNKLNYKESLIKNVSPGCTFVFNNNLKELLSKYDGFMISHDWTTYIIANAVGTVIFDPNPHIYYRLHSNNSIGINSSYERLKKRFERLIKSDQINTRSKVAKNILLNYSDLMNEKDRNLTYIFSNCSSNILYKFKILKYKEFRKLDFIFMLILGRI